MTQAGRASELLKELTGDWMIRRAVQHSDGSQTRALGWTQIKPERGRWRFHETGILILASGAELKFERSYLWYDAGAAIDVHYDDDRPFHRITVGARARDRHICGSDIYNVAYDFDMPGAWQSRWRVEGPRKSYYMVSQYRQPRSSAPGRG